MNFKNKKIFITGGAGFIGSHLAEKLILENKITIFDNFHRDSLKYTTLKKHPNLKIIKGDILDDKLLEKSIEDANVILHLAAIAGVENVIVSPLKTLEVNLKGTYNLLNAINGKSKKIDRFIFLSTSEVYGPYVNRATEVGMTTQGQIKEQRWAYATSKIAGEHWVYAYFKRWGLPATIIRPFNVYGDRQVGESAIHKFAIWAIKNQPLKIFGSGGQVRAWCYIEDFTDAVLKILESKKTIGQVYNIGNPQETLTVTELAKKIIKIAKSSSKITYVKRNYPDVELRIPSIEKANKDFGFRPLVDLDEGILRTLDWYKSLPIGEIE